MADLDFTSEATTLLRFPSDRQFVAYRDEVEDRYDGRMVRVKRGVVFTNGESFSILGGCVMATVHHSRGLGAELRGLAYSQFDGTTVNTIYG